MTYNSMLRSADQIAIEKASLFDEEGGNGVSNEEVKRLSHLALVSQIERVLLKISERQTTEYVLKIQ
jgi:hypothetical protein